MANTPVTDRWPEIKAAAEQGATFKQLGEAFGVDSETIRKRAQREQWLTFTRINAKLSEMSEKVPALAGQGGLALKKREPDNAEVVSLVAANWDERASYIRQLAWQIGKKSLAPLKDTGIAIKDAGDLAKTVKLMREATGLFQDTSAVQVSIFGGAAAGFDGKTVDIDTEIMEAPADYDEEM